MPKSEYQELIVFLGRKFEEVDARRDQMATREDMRAQQAEIRRHFELGAEGLRGPVQLLAEGHRALVEGQERILTRVERMEREWGTMIRISDAELDDRIRKCEQRLAAGQERLARVEAPQA